MRPWTRTFMPFSQCSATVLPRPLNLVIQCHSVYMTRSPFSSRELRPSERRGREMARLKWATRARWTERTPETPRGHGYRLMTYAVAVSTRRSIRGSTAPTFQEGCRPERAESGSSWRPCGKRLDLAKDETDHGVLAQEGSRVRIQGEASAARPRLRGLPMPRRAHQRHSGRSQHGGPLRGCSTMPRPEADG